jgi:hypothetical protein
VGLLDRSDFCSLFVGVDDFYLNKLLVTYPTWVNCHPEIIRMPHVFVADSDQVTALDPRWAAISKAREAAAAANNISLNDAKFYVLPWHMGHDSGISQREEMLTGLIRCAKHLTTPWYLKLDADTYANAKTGFYFDKWFRNDPCYISNPWNYTKPAGTVAKMNEWAKGIPELKDLPEVQAQFADLGNGKTKDVHPRMASWVMFGNTKWTTWVSDLCKDARLPFPSQDTYLSYLQVRTGKNWVPVKFRTMGWQHERNFDGLKRACAETMNRLGVHP